MDETWHGVEINATNTKLITNNAKGLSSKTIVDSQELKVIRHFKYLDPTISEEGSRIK